MRRSVTTVFVCALVTLMLVGCSSTGHSIPTASTSNSSSGQRGAAAVSSTCSTGALGSQFAILATDQSNANVHLEANAAVKGNVGIYANNSQLHLENGATIVGTAYVEKTTQVQAPLGSISGGVNASSVPMLAVAVGTAINESCYDSQLSSTSGLSSINVPSGSLTIPSTGTRTVLNLSSFSMASNATLTFNAAPGNSFVVNVNGQVHLPQGAQVLVAGGISAGDVIFNFVGSQGDVHFEQGVTFEGTILAPSRQNVHLEKNVTVGGAVIADGQDVHIEAAGQVQDTPPTTGSASTNSSALGIYTAPNGITYAFVPNANGLSSVQISNGSTVTAVRIAAGVRNATAASGPPPILVTLSPPPSACAPDVTDKLLFCVAFFNPTVNVLDISGLPSTLTVKATYMTDATSGVPNSSGGCIICGAIYDAADKAIIYATGNGYELYSTPLASPANAHLLTVPVNVSENFGYYPATDTIFSPEYFDYPSTKRSIDVVPLGTANPSVFSLSPAPPGLDDPDAGAVDGSTGIGVSTEEIANFSSNSNTAYLVNIANPTLNSPSSGLFMAPETTTTLSSSLFGANIPTQCRVPITNIAIDSVSHLAFFSAEFCGQSSTDPHQFNNGAATPIGVAVLPSSSTAPLQFGNYIFANLPPLPDGTLWDDALDPHAIAAFNLPGICPDCGAIFNLEQTWIAVVNLQKLLAAPPSPSDPHTVSSAYDLVGNGVVTYIPTGFTSMTADAAARFQSTGRSLPGSR